MLWGGRFEEHLEKTALQFSTSFPIDINLFYEDIQVNFAYSSMLHKIGIITKEELELIHKGLSQIVYNYENIPNYFDLNEFEDVHSAIEKKLFDIIGDVAGKIHTGRSRNDQVATDMRLWCKKLIKIIKKNIVELQKSLIDLAEKHTETLIFGYTHLQRAQPISLAFHLLAYYDALERDKKQFAHSYELADICPLGSSAFAGSTLPIDIEFLTKSLGFKSYYNNAMDGVSDRDFMLSFINSCNNAMLHLSRLAEDLILWSTTEFNLIKLSDKFSTGSSLMPQKKNPDMLELIRGKTSLITGNYTSFSMLLKALPMSYNRDLQEDKSLLWNSYNTYNDSLVIMNGVISTLEVNSQRFAKEIQNDFSIATDIADYLVLKGIPFRTAHKQVGMIIKYIENHKLKLLDITDDILSHLKVNLTKDEIYKILESNPIYRKKTISSPNPEYIKKRIDEIKTKLK
ncbi:MAG TPA: argininosuccinate lyase [Ignavibacteriales bacterium]|nr:argininosuccinate lyase [Ignavibacteriales bacterium]